MASILIVDDSSTVRDDTSNFMKSNGLDVATAVDGNDSLAKKKTVGQTMNISFARKPMLVGLVALIASSGAFAQSEANFKLSGFASVVGGKVFGGSDNFPLGNPKYTAPSYVADWFNAGVYEKKFSLKPETRVGVQGTYEFTKQFSATAQITSRAVDADPSLEWAYLTHKTGNWEFQVGRKRIPRRFQ